MSRQTEYLVYVITNLVNGKKYVGITEVGIRRRWQMHMRDARTNPTTAIRRSIAKHGPDKFSIEPVACARDRIDLQELERAIIAQEGTFGNPSVGYNSTKGGDGGDCSSGRKRSAAHIAAIRAAHIGKRISPEQKAYLRQINLGKTQSAETRQRKADAARGKKRGFTPAVAAQVARLAVLNKGRRATTLARANQSAAMKMSDKMKAHLAKVRVMRFGPDPRQMSMGFAPTSGV